MLPQNIKFSSSWKLCPTCKLWNHWSVRVAISQFNPIYWLHIVQITDWSTRSENFVHREFMFVLNNTEMDVLVERLYLKPIWQPARVPLLDGADLPGASVPEYNRE